MIGPLESSDNQAWRAPRNRAGPKPEQGASASQAPHRACLKKSDAIGRINFSKRQTPSLEVSP